MRHFDEFSATEWLQLLPIQHALKQLRNDARLAIYKSKRPKELSRFLADQKDLANKNIALVTAFEKPWALNWLLRMAKRNLSDTSVLVFDNSRNASKRSEIAQVCRQNDVPYLALPANPTRHGNRSHGMAMTWIYHNVVRAINPRIFGFIDHDLVPVRKVSMADKLSDQPVYGLLKVGKFGFWYLWAGYCFFDYAQTKDKPINFLYDFSRDLDTGGRIWNSLYCHLDRSKLHAARSEHVSVKVPSIESPRLVQFIDQDWLHIGGSGGDSLLDPEHPDQDYMKPGYRHYSEKNVEFFKGLESVFDQGG
jgi:hypothetical protein